MAKPDGFAQGLVIRLHDGSTNIEALNSIQKLTYADTNLIEELKSGTTRSFPISSIQKLYFDYTIGYTETGVINNPPLKVFPNPAGEIINVENIPDHTEIIFMYKSNGQLVLSIPVHSATAVINTGKLDKGLYFIIANGKSSKFIRQ